jgi:hypothetical protein
LTTDQTIEPTGVRETITEAARAGGLAARHVAMAEYGPALDRLPNQARDRLLVQAVLASLIGHGLLVAGPQLFDEDYWVGLDIAEPYRSDFVAAVRDAVARQNRVDAGAPDGGAMTTTYMIVVQDVVNETGAWTTHYLGGPAFDKRADAIAQGIEELGHDDFNIATLDNGRLVAYGWGDDDFGPDAGYDLGEIARQLGLGVTR